MGAETFKLDTSGVVSIPTDDPGFYFGSHEVRWSDLSPFVQGYVEALFELRDFDPRSESADLGFSDVAPETLQRIMEDCERFRARWPRFEASRLNPGASFWANRNAMGVGRWPDFPPLAPYLGDDGRMYLREAS